MKFLLDTHTFALVFKEPRTSPFQGSADHHRSRKGCGCQYCHSLGIAIKVSLKKLPLPGPYEELLPHDIAKSQLEIISIEPRHLVEVSKLPLHHRDPFDRLLIAQARVDGLTILTRDSAFATYNVPVIWQASN